jgi:hypothetical protein
MPSTTVADHALEFSAPRAILQCKGCSLLRLKSTADNHPDKSSDASQVQLGQIVSQDVLIKS